jgi:hypothetical protein
VIAKARGGGSTQGLESPEIRNRERETDVNCDTEKRADGPLRRSCIVKQLSAELNHCDRSHYQNQLAESPKQG